MLTKIVTTVGAPICAHDRKLTVNIHAVDPAPAKHPEYWFRDGNMVLVAKQRTAFRVHASALGRKSPVFNDVLGIPQPEAQDLMDGCPVVHIADDPDDFTVFLAYVYDGWESVNFPMQFCGVTRAESL